MIPLSFWLTNAQFVIGAFMTFAFFAVAWLNIDSWAVRRDTKTGMRAIGFILLAIWSILHGIGIEAIWANMTSAITLFTGILLTTISYFIDILPLQPKELTALQKKQNGETKPATQNIQTTQTIQPNTNIKPNPRVKLPPERRRIGFKKPIKTITGIGIVSITIAAAYFAFNTWMGGNNQKEQSLFVEEETTPEIEEEIVIEEPTPEPEEETTPTVTIQETGTGFLNVREGASTSNKIITTISPADQVELLEEDESGWYKIQVNAETAGWISSQYATKDQ